MRAQDKMVKYINTWRIGRGRWAFEAGGKQEARELGAKPGENVL